MSSLLFIGFLNFWMRPCDLKNPCPLPSPIGISQKVELKVDAPLSKEEEASSLVAKKIVLSGDESAEIAFVWLFPKGADSYVVSRIRLFHKGTALCECTFYSKPEAISFPTGACAGFENGIERGVSFSKNRL